MIKVIINIVCITVFVIVIAGLCLWRASTDWPNWYWFDYTGILGFGVALLTAWIAFFVRKEVKQLSNKYSLKLALPDVKKRLDKIRKTLASFLRSKGDLIIPDVDLSHIIADCLSECKDLGQMIGTQFAGINTTKEIIFICTEIKSGKQISRADIIKLHICVVELINDVDKEIQKLNNEVSL